MARGKDEAFNPRRGVSRGMKMGQEEYDAMASAIAPHDTEENRARYRSGDYPRSEGTKDVDKRYRWDLFWASKHKPSDLADAHIDTALRRAVPPLS